MDAPAVEGRAGARRNAGDVSSGSSRGARVNILVVAPNWLGDVVMALPAIADVRRHFAGATLTIAARGPLAALAAMVPGVDETIALEARGAHIVATLRRNARRLRAGRFDA